MNKLYCAIGSKYRKFKNPKICILEKKQFFLLFSVSVKIKIKKYLKKNN